MEKEKQEELSEYSYSLMKLVNYAIDILKVRKSDIIRRYRFKKNLEKQNKDMQCISFLYIIWIKRNFYFYFVIRFIMIYQIS